MNTYSIAGNVPPLGYVLAALLKSYYFDTIVAKIAVRLGTCGPQTIVGEVVSREYLHPVEEIEKIETRSGNECPRENEPSNSED
jgi:hypothetical protein